ncbi:extracellular solute-binding protein [uncultured Paraglaciecola sp.]|uniref:extracellular solute-binding protein n=1 Tax=uncultured Paraglaciecola sp. TaxID=1765024 RepID=UPI0030DA1145|tara:strand:- start:232597 stop:234489 length:1893 start_codon:yes stop_codon:yes gene_type:complete
MKISTFFVYALILSLAPLVLKHSIIHAKPTPISVAVLTVNKQQIALFAEQFSRFNHLQSEIVVDVDFYSDQGLKSKLSGWLESGKYDLIHWQAGKRLNDIVLQELLLPIDLLIDKTMLENNISTQLLDAVNLNGSYQALPFAYYPWGFYYSKTLFAQHDISPPKSWAEFLAICSKLKKLGIAPLVQASQESWPLLAWIDFLALDNGGIKTRKEMTEFASVDRDSIAKVVEQFSILLDYGYFFAPDHNWRWEQAVTLLVRQQAAMTLIGQFAESEIKAEHNSQIGYFPFPHSRTDIAYPEVAPIDLFVVPLASKNHAYLPAVLDFLVQTETNKALATGLGFLAASTKFDGQGLSERALIGLQSLQKSTGLVQFFDRDTEAKYATNLANSIAHSILNGESSAFKGALSGQDFVNSTHQVLDVGLPEKLLNFSSFTGSRGTFFASNTLSAVYQKLGYNISITRYQNLSESLNSYKYGADGELVRAKVFANQSEDLIQVPEPIAESTIYLVCRTSEACSRKLQSKVEVGTSIDILAIRDWWIKEKVTKQNYETTPLMLQAFESGQLNYMILPAVDVAAYNEQLRNSGYRAILSIPFYHFIHKKHQNMLQEINQGLKEFKKTSAYQDFKTRYWLN